ncbi:MAG TPA: tetratricopeptide repeat protein [Candidatus Deferrimicrobium sp.]|nr:tetratricopeptide repeat protein [Candidatus Deferrimicrobium sp.]
MRRRFSWESAAVVATLALFGIASFYPLQSMWGINHLAFLPDTFKYVFWAVAAIVMTLLIPPLSRPRLESALDGVAHFIWDRGIWPRLLIAGVFTAAFIFFKTETHFLGDGYGWLSILGSGEGYYHKWTEPGSIWLVRKLQALLGGYTPETALGAFRIVSFASGGLFVFAGLGILQRLCCSTEVRLLGVVSLLGSGGILLFLGYVEFYHLLWAATSVFIYVSLRCLQDGRGLGWVFLAFFVSALMHMQAIYFIGGFMFLVFHRRLSTEGILRRRSVWLMGLAALGLSGTALFGWLYSTRLEVETTFLPLFSGRPKSPDYAAFSPKHLLDILNLALVMWPGAVMLLSLAPRKSGKPAVDSTALFLGLLSCGSVAFLFFVNPTLGMARDWDLMSLTLLPPFLLFLRLLDRRGLFVRWPIAGAYVLVVLFMSCCYLTVSTREQPSVSRFHSLLRYYGPMSRGGWATLAYYFRDRGDERRYQRIAAEMDDLYPEYRELKHIYALLETGEYREALLIAERLVEANPYEPDFLQVAGNVYGKLGRFDLAERFYEQAVKLKPHHMILNEYGQLMMKQQKHDQALRLLKRARRLAPHVTAVAEGVGLACFHLGHLDSTSAMADTLFMQDEHSPGGHLLEMVIAISRNDKAKARFHFEQYVRYGSHRSDYKSIREYYSYLAQ